MTERKLASVKRIDEVRAIPDADKICGYRIGGWWVVDQVGKYVPGDLVVYVECDSFVPSTVAPFLTKEGSTPKNYNGVTGERLKTVRLRKQISQGLLLPLSVLTMVESELFEGLDVSFPLGIVKYEPPVSLNTSGESRGVFPSQIPKTDQERIQNLAGELAYWQEKGFTWEVTEKLEGQSFTAYLLNDEFGVCSRNINLRQSPSNLLWQMAEKYKIEEKLRALGMNIAVQAELVGPGVQGNIYKLKQHELAIFDVYDIDRAMYYTPEQRAKFAKEMDMVAVPTLYTTFSLTTYTIESLLQLAEGKSVFANSGVEREGIVFKCENTEASFKAVSNRYLLKHGD